jgi:hypothetical protein
MTRVTVLAFYALVLGLGLLASGPVLAGGQDEAQGVQSTDGNPSPTAATSNVDNYINQEDRVNIDGNRDATVKVLRVNQKNLVNDFVVGVYPIERAMPREIRALFRTITQKEGGTAEVICDKVAKKYFLQVICPTYQLPYIDAAVKALDEPWVTDEVDGSREFYYRAKFRDVGNLDAVASIPGDGDGVTTVIDTASNAIFKRMEPYRAQQWLQTAELVDLFPPQLVLDAAVYEVELTDDLKLGLDYVAWKCGPGRNLFDFTFWGFGSDQDAEHVTSIFDPFTTARQKFVGTKEFDTRGRGYYAAVNFLLTAEYIDFMVHKGRARLVTAGKLSVKHGTVGTLSVTDEVLHFKRTPNKADLIDPKTGKAVSGIDDLLNKICLEHRDDVTVGFTLTVNPFIGLETTELVYALTMNDIVGATPSGTPIVRTNSELGSVQLRDGTPICVGGMRRSEDVKSTAKVPLLGSIPILGYLFGGEQNSNRQTELVVVFTPQVVQYNEVQKELARPEDKEVRAQVLKRAKLPMLKTEWGFDQWLLGKD